MQPSLTEAWKASTAATVDNGVQKLTFTFGSYPVDCSSFQGKDSCAKSNGDYCQYSNADNACTPHSTVVVEATQRVAITCTNNLAVAGSVGDVTFGIETSTDEKVLASQVGYTIEPGKDLLCNLVYNCFMWAYSLFFGFVSCHINDGVVFFCTYCSIMRRELGT